MQLEAFPHPDPHIHCAGPGGEFNGNPFEISASRYEVAVAVNCVDDSPSAVEADLISVTAACMVALTTSASLPTTQSMIPSTAMSPGSTGFSCVSRNATARTASLMACDMPGNKEI